MIRRRINIHISDDDFFLMDVDVHNTEIRTISSAYGRFIFTEHPRIIIDNVRFTDSYIRLFGVKNCMISNCIFEAGKN